MSIWALSGDQGFGGKQPRNSMGKRPCTLKEGLGSRALGFRALGA